METKYGTARPEDFDDVMDFGNYVFSHAHRSIDFPSILPKLYKREFFNDAIHYIAREDGKIKAAVGAYPLEWEFPGPAGLVLPGRGIGMVSVHPYARSRGYMKELMKRALDDMRRDGMVFSCLSGQRQRYEYFGFTPAGSAYSFNCEEGNIRHTLGPDRSAKLASGRLSFKSVGPGDKDLLDSIQALHEAKPARLRRQRDRLYEILSSWRARILAVMEGDFFAGYLIYKTNGTEHEITEINLTDLSLLPEVLGLFLHNGKAAGMKDSVKVGAGPHETEKIAALSRFAEDYTENWAYHFQVFDYRRFVEPFMKLKARDRALADGSVVLRIEGSPPLLLSVAQGVPSAATQPSVVTQPLVATTELSLSRLDALHFLFSPLAVQTFPAIKESVFLRSLLPLPLFFESADGI